MNKLLLHRFCLSTTMKRSIRETSERVERSAFWSGVRCSTPWANPLRWRRIECATIQLVSMRPLGPPCGRRYREGQLQAVRRSSSPEGVMIFPNLPWPRRLAWILVTGASTRPESVFLSCCKNLYSVIQLWFDSLNQKEITFSSFFSRWQDIDTLLDMSQLFLQTNSSVDDYKCLDHYYWYCFRYITQTKQKQSIFIQIPVTGL